MEKGHFCKPVLNLVQLPDWLKEQQKHDSRLNHDTLMPAVGGVLPEIYDCKV